MEDIKVEFGALDAAIKDAETIGDEAVRLLAFEWLDRSSMNLQTMVYTRSPADEREEPTGALLNSGYVRTWLEDFSHIGEAGAVARNPLVTFGSVPPSPGKGEAQILYAVEYAVYVHEGTRFMEGRAYLRSPAPEIAELWEPTVRTLLQRRGW